jgi:hypothetical protein
MISRTAAAAAAIAAAAVLASCSSSLPAGPLAGPRTPGTECTPARGAKVMTDGFDAVRNTGKATAVIEKVAMADPKGLRLLHAYAVRTEGIWYGVQAGYPPGHVRLPGWHWDTRQNADGARVPPATGKHDYWNLLLVVAPEAARSTYAGIDIWYRVGDNHYHWRTVAGLLLLTKRRSCSP